MYIISRFYSNLCKFPFTEEEIEVQRSSLHLKTISCPIALPERKGDSVTFFQMNFPSIHIKSFVIVFI